MMELVAIGKDFVKNAKHIYVCGKQDGAVWFQIWRTDNATISDNSNYRPGKKLCLELHAVKTYRKETY
jgi:hypothetical protein